ncbi:lipid A deacylase LpxR family protein [Opitutia bacterium ISCC 51]|nr:lipid A deacylase LpxR family protein [Opitutae bacterium ISCC 51]QXD28438.1 lipid A deacylase LpxR family protein [Opitutae bacterium ISCC 52]
MKQILTCSLSGLLVFSACVWGQDDFLDEPLEKPGPWSLNIYFENDLFSDTDQQYTNGTKVSWVSPYVSEYVHTNFPVLTEFFDREVHFLSDAYNVKNLAFSIGQNMYTPEDIAANELIETDRPYAAWLYLSAGFHAKNDRIQDTFEVQLGMVGPAALGEEIQDIVHDFRGIPKANGWGNQIRNELGLNLVGERRIRLEADNTGMGNGCDCQWRFCDRQCEFLPEHGGRRSAWLQPAPRLRYDPYPSWRGDKYSISR